MQQACLQPTKEEIISVIKKTPNWNMFTTNYLMARVMKHFKGKLNPAFARPIVEQFVEGVR